MLTTTPSHLTNTLIANERGGLDNIDLAPNQGKLLYLLAKLCYAQNVLESSSPGKVISLEIDPKHAEVARENIKDSGHEANGKVRVGPALASLAEMETERWGKEGKKVDLVFIDANKADNVGYLEYGLKFARKGAVIVVDNVGRNGRISDNWKGEVDKSILGSRDVMKRMRQLGKEGRLEGTAVQTVGSKGWNGFSITFVC
ncbi:hypothetical protein EYC80_007019 [Monilinia laxa]|uniref:O-methyltransferase domain-containing protein n=1 Tax=Monilinia laxa TaxID=61186 RepID=A0A5N6JZX9_MONLA|nr:hypothetical protein EYC80_007019 [Monilinia laxa]